MLEFKNKVEYNQYAAKLSQAIEHDSWKEFMDKNKYMDVYFSSTYVPNIKNLSSPYFNEIAVSSVLSCNVSSARKEIPSNWERVVGAVRYILEEQCMPIAVIKLDNNRYYIENGKHRFYAHVLLGKKNIPVSVREMAEENTPKETMLSCNIPFYNNDGMDIAYPEKIEDFNNQYMNVENRIELIAKKATEIENLIAGIEKSLDVHDRELLRKQLRQLESLHYDLKTETKGLADDFTGIKSQAKSVKIKKADNVRHTLSIEMNDGRNIIITGACSSGNATRASKCTCNILNKLGYRVDMEYISRHSEFKLEDKRDAHNINFDVAISIDLLQNLIMNIDEKEKWFDSDKYNSDFQMLIKYLSNCYEFTASAICADYGDSSIVKINDIYYYILIDDSKKNIYIFQSGIVPFDNLDLQFLGRLDSKNEFYEKLI